MKTVRIVWLQTGDCGILGGKTGQLSSRPLWPERSVDLRSLNDEPAALTCLKRAGDTPESEVSLEEFSDGPERP